MAKESSLPYYLAIPGGEEMYSYFSQGQYKQLCPGFEFDSCPFPKMIPIMLWDSTYISTSDINFYKEPFIDYR